MYDLSLWGSARGTPRKLKEPLKKSGVSSWLSECAQSRRSARVIAIALHDAAIKWRDV